MLVEIHGTGLENKGGQLMMQAVIRRLGPLGARFAMNPRLDAPPSELVPLGVRPLLPPTGNNRPRSLPWQLRLTEAASRRVPASILKLYEAEPRHAVAALIDVSGYAFGDLVSPGNIQCLAARAAHHRRQGRPVVLMPQMLGPFERPEVAAAMRRLLPQPHLLYVRDAHSMDHLARLVAPGPLPASVRRAPDITIFESPTDADRTAAAAAVPEGFVGLVPNVRMYDRGDGSWRDIYLDRLTAAGRAAEAAGRPVRIIVHETVGPDAELAAELARRLGGSTGEPVQDANPLRLKAVIARARLLVASRFHSIVAALASGVPAVALGWSHKYDALLEDFGIGHLVHRSEDDEAHLVTLIDGLIADAAHAEVTATLSDRREQMRGDAEQMWSDVCDLLGLPASRP